MTRKVKQYFFTIKCVNIEEVNKRFGLFIESNMGNTEDFIPENSTKLSELANYKNKNISFTDESKQLHKCNISMIDFTTQQECNFKYDKNCFWCRHSIPENKNGIGCPIKYIPNKCNKTYYSEISKDIYSIKQNITPKKGNEIKDENVHVQKNDYYLTDGIFCSFNCCMAWINDNSHNSLYDMSKILLLSIFHNLYNLYVIEEAPHWRKLRKYGGELTIEQFRSGFNNVEYKNHGQYIPSFKSVGFLFEEKLKL